jgi:hypothetical protein
MCIYRIREQRCAPMNSTGWPALVISASLLVAPGSPASSYGDRSSFSADGVRSAWFTPHTLAADHRYRIIGKVRFLLFWIGNDNVGGARVTWRAEEGGRHAIALLIGTEPARAPRGINKWGYVGEELQNEDADVFGIRSITDAKSLDEAEARLAQGSGPALFGAMCSSMTATEALAFTATVRVPAEVTYRQLGRLLDSIGSSTQWLRHHTARPAGADPGFLTALQSLVRTSVETAQHGTGRTEDSPSRVYVYKGALFDLRLTQSRRIDRARVGSEIFRDLIRSEFAIRNRSTGYSTQFDVTYGVNGELAGVPVQASYQPHWWLKLELALDDALDVPLNPIDDNAVAEQLRRICQDAKEQSQ